MEITNTIKYVGVNDHRIDLFEMPADRFSTITDSLAGKYFKENDNKKKTNRDKRR